MRRNDHMRMSATKTVAELHEFGLLLLRGDAILPPDMTIESDAFLPGWRVVRNLDGYRLHRKITNANWHFVRLAGEHKARAVGRAYPGTLRRGVTRILSELRGRKFNSLEITVVGLKRFVGLAFITLSASRRHIQDGVKVTP